MSLTIDVSLENVRSPVSRAALTEACRKASQVQPVAEPLDWFERFQPAHWRFGDQEKTYDWNVETKAN